MAIETTEPRALTAALAQPAFHTTGGTLALSVADRHVDRWAPERESQRSIKNLGFVDRLVAPWLESAQRSQSLRLFSGYMSTGMAEREGDAVSWVFPRPWYQDELDWMAAARHVATQSQVAATPAPQMLTTRGTYMADAPQARAAAAALPSALYEFVAPSLSIAKPQQARATGGAIDAYSPLVSVQAAQAAHVMARAMAPVAASPAARMSPGLRAVLTTMLERSASPGATGELPATRLAADAPELVTPPAPRDERDVPGGAAATAQAAQVHAQEQAAQVATQIAAERARIAELQRAAKLAGDRESQARLAQEAAKRTDELRAASERAQAEQRAAEQRTAEQRAQAERAAAEQRALAERAEREQGASHAAELRSAAARAEAAQRALDARVAEQRAAEQRVAEVRAVEHAARAADPRSPTARVAEPAAAAPSTPAPALASEAAADAAERRRIEERIAQRLAERSATAAPRLHESARDAAARDARQAATVDDAPASARTETTAAPAPVAAASAWESELAALPPELAHYVRQRAVAPGQAMSDLGDALRTVELLAHTAAHGGTFHSARGPRVVMPAGLGGLVATLAGTRRGAGQGVGALADATLTGAPAGGDADAAQPARTRVRVPQLAWLQVGASDRAPDTGSATASSPLAAVGAIQSSLPAALQHVAWADRWLARFAGAQPQSLEMLRATSASPELQLQALASLAPEAVFVSPAIADDPQTAAAVASAEARITEQSAAAARSPSSSTAASPEAQARAYAESQARAQAQTQARIAGTPSQPGTSASPAQVQRFSDDDETPDDVLVAISAAATRARRAPAPAAPASAASAQAPSQRAAEPAAWAQRMSLADAVAHAVPGAPGAGLSAQLASSPFAAALRHVLPLAAASTFDIRSLFGGGIGATYLAGLLDGTTRSLQASGFGLQASGPEQDFAPLAPRLREALDFVPSYVSPTDDSATTDAGATSSSPAASRASAITTLRSALLSFDVEAGRAPTLARSMVGSFQLPMQADRAATREPGTLDVAGETTHLPTYAAPGMIADRAQSWSIAQERSSADLSFDFVPPELVLAARVYGLGPAEAAQALRLAIAGPGPLTAMAGAIDRTFVQALAIESSRRDELRATSSAALSHEELAVAIGSRAARRLTGESAATDAAGSFDGATTTFGVERRAPRGAFLWPAATVGALGLDAPAPDGDHAMSVAALELLAAQAVAELGTYAALAEQPMFDGAMPSQLADAQQAMAAMPSTSEPATPGDEPGARSLAALGGGALTLPTSLVRAAEDHVFAAAGSLASSSRRAKFEALYLALGSSPSARTWSPAVRAARALALAGRGDETITPRERAAIAWDVLPIVAPSLELGSDGQPGSLGGAAGARGGSRGADGLERDGAMSYVAMRPGMGGLSARAGEALGSYVAPSGAPQGGQSSRDQGGAVHRAPTAAPELVRTGRPSGRHGGGEVEIPAWFEQAARKMFDDRAGSDSFSFSELTLVTASRPAQIAASAIDGPVGPSSQPSAMPLYQLADEARHLDIHKLADEVHKHVMNLMDSARSRNGEP